MDEERFRKGLTYVMGTDHEDNPNSEYSFCAVDVSISYRGRVEFGGRAIMVESICGDAVNGLMEYMAYDDAGCEIESEQAEWWQNNHTYKYG